jgi:hypothetical protein
MMSVAAAEATKFAEKAILLGHTQRAYRETRRLSNPVLKRLVPKQVLGIITDVNFDPLVRCVTEREQSSEKNRATKDVHNDFTHR